MNVSKICSAPSIKTSGNATTEVFTWTRQDATTLVVINATCAAKYPDSPSSASLYCRVELSKQ